MRIDEVDFAKIDPCPSCGVPVRRMGNVPIRGNGLDGEPSGPWWCSDCIAAKTDEAARGIRS